MSIANHPTGQPEKAALRRTRALDLRVEGKSIRAIASALGISVGQAHKDLRLALEAVAERERERAHLVRTEELAKLDALEETILPRALAGDQPALDRELRLMERRSRLLGLDAPTKVAPTDPSGDNPYASISDEQLRLDLLRLVTVFTGTDGADPGGGEIPLEPDRASEPAAAAG